MADSSSPSPAERPLAVVLPPPDSGFGLEDLYKLLHQAFQGPGHAIPSRAAADGCLRSEWETLHRLERGEGVIEILLPDAPFVRVHLRPYRNAGGTPKALLEAFLRSAAVPVDPGPFLAAWRNAERMIEAGELPFRKDAYEALDAWAASAGYPAIHHSSEYLERARPAYRVLAILEAERLLRDLHAPPRQA